MIDHYTDFETIKNANTIKESLIHRIPVCTEAICIDDDDKS